LVEGGGSSKHWWKKGEREETFSNISLQLTAVHVRHFGGIPLGNVAVESNDERKHW